MRLLDLGKAAPIALGLATSLAYGQEEAKLLSTDAAGGDFLGHSVGISGDTLIVGATGDDDAGTFTGSAYVFTGGVGGWTQQQKLLASDAGIAQRFGWSADLDGETAVVGAIFGNGLASVSGSAYVFTRTGTSWSEQQKLQASDGAMSDWFSRSIAISGDTIAVGSAQDDDLGADSGSVYIYERSGSTWTETAKLKASDGTAGDTFGEALSLSGDLLVVGSPQDDDAGSASGAAYVFERSLGVWTQTGKLTARDGTPTAWLGKTVHTDGQKVIVGAYRGDDLPNFGIGVAYIFSNPGGGWTEEAKLVASHAEAGDEFGWSVNIRANEALVGSDKRDSGTGAVYRFLKDSGGWSEDSIHLASDASSSDSFGWALARDGEAVVVGATQAAGPGGNSGAAYVFRFLDPFQAYCFGDGSGTACPCGNTGALGAGCSNSETTGARLAANGSNSVTNDDLILSGSALPANKPALLFVGTLEVNGGDGLLFGDGLRCAGGAIQRLGVKQSQASGEVSWGPGLAAAHGFSASDTRQFQIWYRDPIGQCNSGFNLTHGLGAMFVP